MYKTVEQVEVDIEKAYEHLKLAQRLLDEAVALSEDSELPGFNRWRMSVVIPYLRIAVENERARCDVLLTMFKEVIAEQGKQLQLNIG